VKCKASHGKSEEKGEFGNPWNESLRFNVVPQSYLNLIWHEQHNSVRPSQIVYIFEHGIFKG
jgi:hypothetical protein